MLPKVPLQLWRKSSQWISMKRRHAVLAQNDTEVFAIFEEGMQAQRLGWPPEPHALLLLRCCPLLNNSHYFSLGMHSLFLCPQSACIADSLQTYFRRQYRAMLTCSLHHSELMVACKNLSKAQHYADEHYFATLLAFLHEEEETSCAEDSITVVWSRRALTLSCLCQPNACIAWRKWWPLLQPATPTQKRSAARR